MGGGTGSEVLRGDSTRVPESALPWLRRLLLPRGLVRLIGGSVLSGGAIIVVPPEAIWSLLTVGGVTYTIRCGIHVHMGYLRQTGPAGQTLRRLTHGDLIVMLTFNAVWGCAWAFEPAGWLLAVMALVLCGAVLLISGATIGAARAAKLKRGSEWVRQTHVVKWIEGALAPHATVFGGPFLKVIQYATPVQHASCYIVCVLALLVSAAGAEVITSVPGVPRPLESQSHGDSAKQPSSSGDTSSTTPGGKPGSSDPAPRAQEEPPSTYEQMCGDTFTGYPAPELVANALAGLFNQAGALVAGCAGVPATVEGHPETWWVVGFCDGVRRSVAVVTPAEPAALMLQQVADFAAAKALAGQLTGASPRIPAGHGDFQIVQTEEGNYVLAREELSRGRIGPHGHGHSCAQLADRNSRYTVVPPALVGLWVELVQKEWVWPVGIGQGQDGSKLFVFLSGREGAKAVATATCGSAHTCTMWRDGQPTASVNPDGSAAPELARYAPRPAE